MNATVSSLSIAMMAFAGICSVAIPLILLIYYRKKGADYIPFFIGCAVMLFFALMLEQLIHMIVLNSPAGESVLNNTILYALYGGIMAGLSEETGRFVAFKFLMKRFMSKDINALMYGAGHGGFEAVAIMGLQMVVNISFAVMINTGGINTMMAQVPADQLPQLQSQIDAMVTTEPVMFLVAVIERIIAIALHISESVFVWFAVKSKKTFLYPVAILIHAIADGVTVIVARSGIPGAAFIAEVVIAVFTAAVAFAAYNLWKKETAANGNARINADI